MKTDCNQHWLRVLELLVGVVGVGGQHIKVAVQNFLFFPSKGFAES